MRMIFFAALLSFLGGYFTGLSDGLSLNGSQAQDGLMGF